MSAKTLYPAIEEMIDWLWIADVDAPEDADDPMLVRFARDQIGDDPDSKVSDEALAWLCTDEGMALGLGLLGAVRSLR